MQVAVGLQGETTTDRPRRTATPALFLPPGVVVRGYHGSPRDNKEPQRILGHYGSGAVYPAALRAGR